MGKARILIVEDEPRMALFIKKGLEENRFETSITYEGSTAIEQALTGHYDLVLLDLNLSAMNSCEVCRQIRARQNLMPVLMLGSPGTIEDKLAGFESGADDYLVRPFDFRELLARIRALLKRSGQRIFDNVLKVADLELNADTKTVRRGGNTIELTAKEFSLLELLMRNKGKVISRAEIAGKIWNINFDTGTNVIDVYINFLRKKIDKSYPQKLISTYIGMGYTIKEAE
jgi:two-component system copper resistance phosphate regulon response regulator CusR